MNSRYISVDITIPPEALNDSEFQRFKEDMKSFEGGPLKDAVKYEINNRVCEFEQYLKDNYPYDKWVKCKLRGDIAYFSRYWTLKDILKHHKQYCPDRHTEKREYTRREVNNMLFNLQLEDVIGGYSNVAVPYVGMNEEVWDGGVDVEVRYEFL